MTKSRHPKLKNQALLWIDKVREKVRQEIRLCHAFLHEKTVDNCRMYQEAKKAIMETGGVAKTAHDGDLN
ncbi:unnamed protein product [Heligmosomoides polygyrus]|uniref:RNA polymerase sigma factor n=1 Tax=Heligmosomoides polygyrus TaxID=6339 RepID=A0A183GNM1_HELPZ|nr:unnamed protein product [Heligmosomoides polygyrus]